MNALHTALTLGETLALLVALYGLFAFVLWLVILVCVFTRRERIWSFVLEVYAAFRDVAEGRRV